MIVVESFKAHQHPRVCKTFIEKHSKILQIFDLANITSAKADWAFNPSTIVITVKDKTNNDMIAGARIQVADGVLNLPIEDAVSSIDTKIYDIIRNERLLHGTSEACGLWNTRKAAKIGLGSIFLMRALLAVSSQLNVQSIFTLCAPSTVKSVIQLGGTIVTEIGNEGTFYYPKLDLIATAVKIPNTKLLHKTNPNDKELILDLRNNPQAKIIEVLRKEEVEIQYSLLI